MDYLPMTVQRGGCFHILFFGDMQYLHTKCATVKPQVDKQKLRPRARPCNIPLSS